LAQATKNLATPLTVQNPGLEMLMEDNIWKT